MLARPARFAWMTSGLYWRTFFLLAFLIAASMAAWVASIRIVERTPRADQIAAQVVSIVTITRSALLHSAPASRRELLFDLASNQIGSVVQERWQRMNVERPPALFGDLFAGLGDRATGDQRYAAGVLSQGRRAGRRIGR